MEKLDSFRTSQHFHPSQEAATPLLDLPVTCGQQEGNMLSWVKMGVKAADIVFSMDVHPCQPLGSQ